MPQPEWIRVAAIAFITSVLQISPAVAGQQSMYFRHLSLEEGLSQNTVTSILQDSQGFMWLGTESGLNRYDGLTVTRFNRDVRREGGLQSDYIWALAEDQRGDIWIGTGNGGVARWDRRLERFFGFRHDPNNPDSLGDDAVRTLLIDRDGYVWVGLSENGLDRLDPVTGTVTHYRHNADDPDSLPSDAVYALHQDRSGALWIGTDAGVSRLNQRTGQFSRYLDEPASDDGADRVRVIQQDHQGVIWIGTFGGGLVRLDPANGSFRRFTHDAGDETSLSNDHIRAIFEDESARLWIGTASGLNLLHRPTMSFRRYYKGHLPESLNDGYIMSIYQDRGGLMWFGTRSGGANLWNPRSWSLGHYLDPWLQDTNVTGFATHGKRLWVATFDAGVAELVGNTMVNRLEPPLISEERVMSLLYDPTGALWVGSLDSGLDRYDLRTGRTTNYRHDPTDPESLAANGVMSLYLDSSGSVWVGTFGGGVHRLNVSTNTFSRFSEQDGLSNSRATAIVEDANGFIWVGTEGGLNRIDPESGEIVSYQHDSDTPGSLSANTVYALHVDAEGGLWIGTSESGLAYLRNPKDRDATFESLTQADGLPSNLIYGIQSDHWGNLWLSTNAGLARLNPRTREMKVFRKSHGLQGDEFNFGAHHRGERGMLYFGGANGFNAISPELLEEERRAPPIVLTGIQKMNKPAATSLPYALLAQLVVDYDETVVTFEFAALDFTSPLQNRFEYRLDGFDSEWNYLQDGHRATYTNLDAGEYVFRARGASSEGTWNYDGLALPVVVQPAPWRTPWAYGGYSAGALLVLLLIVRQQTKKRALDAQHRRHLQHLAYVDQLTGIANRQLFRRRLKGAIEDCHREGDRLALIYVDLDDFKRINDTLGHRCGDEMLKEVAKRLSAALTKFTQTHPRLTAEIARLGGDEFVLLLKGIKDQRPAEHLVKQIFEALGRSFGYQGQQLMITPSIGISVCPQDGDTIESLMKNADIAMYEAKNAGRNEYRFYDRRMSQKIVEQVELENELRHALETDQLTLAYQPKVELCSMDIVGAEALARWHHPRLGEIPPDRFVAIAEKSMLIRDLDRWVVRNVAAQISDWLEAGRAVVPVAVNISGRELTDGGLVAWLSREVEQSGTPPHYLEIELTETTLMTNHTLAESILSRLQALGFKVSIDDFGTGHSSLSYLKRFPVSALKIDRSFIVDLEEDEQDRALCAAIISMAKGLRLTVVAEGVETEQQKQELIELGCEQGQGFGLHAPMSAEAFARLLSSHVQRDGGPGSLLRYPNVDRHARV